MVKSMVRYTTPTFTLTLPDTVDLTLASNVYVTFAKTNIGVVVTKTGDALEISAHQVDVYLNQEETGSFSTGAVKIQINWTYANGERACTDIATVDITPNLLDEVVL